MKIELRTKTETVYISDDGKEFSTKASCLSYEDKKITEEMEDYFRTNGTYFGEGYDGVPGFMGVGGYESCIIKLDDTVYSWLKYMNDACEGKHYLFSEDYKPRLEGMRGKVVLFSFPDFRDFCEWYIAGEKSEIADQMCKSIDWLNSLGK